MGGYNSYTVRQRQDQDLNLDLSPESVPGLAFAWFPGGSVGLWFRAGAPESDLLTGCLPNPSGPQFPPHRRMCGFSVATDVHGEVALRTVVVSTVLEKVCLLKSYLVQQTPSGPNQLGVTRLANHLGRQK